MKRVQKQRTVGEHDIVRGDDTNWLFAGSVAVNEVGRLSVEDLQLARLPPSSSAHFSE